MITDPKLSDTQLVILNAACGRAGRCVFPIPISVKAKGGALDKVLRSLLAKGMVETVPAGLQDAEWARSDDDEPLTLVATTLALDTLGIEPEPHEVDEAEPPEVEAADEAPTAADGAEAAEPAGGAAGEDEPAPQAPAAPRQRRTRADSKQARLIAMLRRPEGASIPEIAEEMAWQHHSVRGAIAGALKKKLGLDVTSEKDDARGRVYKLPQEG